MVEELDITVIDAGPGSMAARVGRCGLRADAEIDAVRAASGSMAGGSMPVSLERDGW